MKYATILNALFCEPLAIVPTFHRELCQLFYARVAAGNNDFGVSGLAVDDGRPTCGMINGEYSDRIPYGLCIEGDLARICLDGPISRHVPCGFGLVDFENAFAFAEQDPSISGIILEIDSPGGSCNGTLEAAQMVKNSSKPVVSFCAGTMASAAYWIGCASDVLVAQPTANVGCIGTYIALLDQSRAMEMQGLKTELFKKGKYKAMGMPGIELTDDQRDHLQASVDQIDGWFKAFVSSQRPGVPVSAMEGQCFFGADAVNIGLIDRVGGLSVAVEELRGLIEYRGQNNQ